MTDWSSSLQLQNASMDKWWCWIPMFVPKERRKEVSGIIIYSWGTYGMNQTIDCFKNQLWQPDRTHYLISEDISQEI